MDFGSILLIVVFVAFVGSLPWWGYSRNWGFAPAGILYLVLVLVLILSLIGTLSPTAA